MTTPVLNRLRNQCPILENEFYSVSWVRISHPGDYENYQEYPFQAELEESKRAYSTASRHGFCREFLLSPEGRLTVVKVYAPLIVSHYASGAQEEAYTEINELMTGNFYLPLLTGRNGRDNIYTYIPFIDGMIDGDKQNWLTRQKMEEQSKINMKNTGDFLAKSLKNAGSLTSKAYSKTKQYTAESYESYKFQNSEVTPENWYLKTAIACEDVTDSLLRNSKGSSEIATKAFVGKLGAAGTSAGIFSLASIFGTASTGTAIGSLSGAALTSASLAWVGGSVAAGSIVLGVAAVAGGLGAAIGAGWASKKYLKGAPRAIDELTEMEGKVIESCLALASTFRELDKNGKSLDPQSSKALYYETLKPLCDELLEINLKNTSWPYLAKKKLKDAIWKLQLLSSWIKGWSSKNPTLSIGIVSVVFIKLLSEVTPEFSQNEELVLEALRRSSTKLNDASIEELSEYVSTMEPNQIAGLQNNVKGIYHEIRYAHEENADGDEYTVELFTETNHPGADVVIKNQITGEEFEYQLKAVSTEASIRSHNEKYQSIEILATTEISEELGTIGTTGLSNEELKRDVRDTLEALDDIDDSLMTESMAIAALVSLSKNIGVYLKNKDLTVLQKEALLKDSAKASALAGLISFIVT
jgi:hypothetical protein